MYKIYINENVLFLADTQSVKGLDNTKARLVAPYSGKTKMLLSYIDMMEKTDRFSEIILHYHDFETLKKDTKALFKIVKASGGVVNDGQDNILFIHRRGSWDLPKGKIDKGEKKKEAAIREVEEETGIKDIILHEKVLTTRHTYKSKSGQRCIKKTYWYTMTAPHQSLIPQEEEDIEEAIWVAIPDISSLEGPMYRSIADVTEEYLRMQTKRKES